MVLKSRNMKRNLRNEQHATENTNEGPECNDEIAHRLLRVFPSIPQEMRDGARHPVPWRRWNERVQHGIDVEVPPREVDAAAAAMAMAMAMAGRAAGRM